MWRPSTCRQTSCSRSPTAKPRNLWGIAKAKTGRALRIQKSLVNLRKTAVLMVHKSVKSAREGAVEGRRRLLDAGADEHADVAGRGHIQRFGGKSTAGFDVELADDGLCVGHEGGCCR